MAEGHTKYISYGTKVVKTKSEVEIISDKKLSEAQIVRYTKRFFNQKKKEFSPVKGVTVKLRFELELDSKVEQRIPALSL